ncbi:MAG: alanine--tRNA ligase [Defluviitaleaceae bacterium]|nr:alanine--tRNA ligase [Defluviitaleaceae bacterium]
MKKLGVNEIREQFLTFFEEQQHLRIPSFSLVPDGDKSLLLINAGMAPLKPYFMGTTTPPAKRATSCQKCIRTGDIENVGLTARHGTFFEMLGNFSFADYFKRESIFWAWEFVTKQLELPVDKLYVTVHLEDDDAENIWHKEVGVAKERIYRLGEDNFWELTVGPCGPCSEIYFDRGAEFGQDDFVASVTAGEDRYLEFWNLVFIQFDKQEDGSYADLAQKGIDTGMGLERIAMIMQGENSIFDVDTIKAVRDKVSGISGVKYTGTFEPAAKHDVSIRIVTDHIRSVVFMMSDGIIPGGGDREYVLRRLLRRAARHGRTLGINRPFLADLAQTVIDNSKYAYPALGEKNAYILRLITQEEERFNETLEGGMNLLRGRIADAKAANGIIAGVDAFKLHDTYGFPVELTQEILEEEGLTLDMAEFDAEMQAQKERARLAREDAGYVGHEATIFEELKLEPVQFVGYTKFVVDDAKILHITSGEEALVVVDKTPVYAEAGGQKADFGVLETATGKADIVGCVKVAGGQFAHIAKVVSGTIEVGQAAKIAIDKERRADIVRNHTATHLLHSALGKVLGEHVQQAGASKSPEALRFDFTHFAPLTSEEICAIEDMVNAAIWANLPVSIEEMPVDEAKKRGAVALFGEKYGDVVRVVDIGGVWAEFCGGCHLDAVGSIGSFKIVSEAGIAAGVRRIEAVTGKYALAYYRQNEDKLADIAQLLKTPVHNLLGRVEQLVVENKEQRKELERAKQKDAQAASGDILKQGEAIGEITLYSATLDGLDMDGLRTLSDDLISKVQGNGVLLLAAVADGKANVLARATDSAVKTGVHCGNMVKAAATAVGGGGGGRPNMAQAGIKDAAMLPQAMEAAKRVVLL